MTRPSGGPESHNLFPIEIRALYPSTMQSRDMRHQGESIDGQVYAIKEKLPGQPFIPASEYFCSRLAQACGIPTLDIGIARLPNGDLAFASTWVLGQEGTSKTLQYLGDANGPCAGDLVNIFLFDMFVHNVDRHAGNYFFKDSKKKPTVRAFDHSRALFTHNWPLPRLPLPTSCSTMVLARTTPIQRNLANFPCDDFLDKLKSFTSQHAADILSNIPTDWMPKPMKNDVIGTWDSFANQRVMDIRSFVTTVGQP